MNTKEFILKIMPCLQKGGVVFLILISVILCLAGIDDGHNWGGDFSLYIAQAKSIVEGTTKTLYLENHWAMAHIPNYGPDLYPPGFPVLLAPLYYIFGIHFIAFKIYMIVFFILACFFSYQLFKDKFDDKIYVYLLLILLLFNRALVQFLDNVLSDIPFLFFTVFAFYCIDRFFHKKHIGLHCLIGLLLSIPFSIRTIGLSLVLAFACYHFLSDFKQIRRQSRL